MTRGGSSGGHQKGLYSWLESTSTTLPSGTAAQRGSGHVTLTKVTGMHQPEIHWRHAEGRL